MTPQVDAPSWEFSLRFPNGWVELPLDGSELDRQIDNLAARAPGDYPDAEIARLRAMFRKAVIEAVDHGVVSAAGYAEWVGAGAPPGDGVLLEATAVMSMVPARALKVADPRVNTRILEIVLASESMATGRRLEKPKVVSLLAGEAVEVHELERSPAPELKKVLRVLAITYYVPSPDESALLMMSFRTPCLGLAEEFAESFRAVAQTLEFKIYRS